jgi:hypothetical protein
MTLGGLKGDRLDNINETMVWLGQSPPAVCDFPTEATIDRSKAPSRFLALHEQLLGAMANYLTGRLN